MRNALLLIGTIVLATSPAYGQGTAWADKLFQGNRNSEGNIEHDFGIVPRGTQLEYRFPITNIWAIPIDIMDIRQSCGCVRAEAHPQHLGPRESGYLDVHMDSTRWPGGFKTVTVYVRIGPQFTSTATLQVKATTRVDVVFNPGEVNFGVVAGGTEPPQQVVDIEYAGNMNWRVTDISTNGAPVDVSFSEFNRQPGRVGYHITVALKPDAPPGLIKQELTVKTNDPNSPKVPLLIEATVQAALAVSPHNVNFGVLPVGAQAEKKVVIRADKPFSITSVEGIGEGVDVDLPAGAAKTQILTVKYQPGQAGDLVKQIKIKTSLSEQSSASLTIEAQAKP
jgi:hypothetical protein